MRNKHAIAKYVEYGPCTPWIEMNTVQNLFLIQVNSCVYKSYYAFVEVIYSMMST